MSPNCIVLLANTMDEKGILSLDSESRVLLAANLYMKHKCPVIPCGWENNRNSQKKISHVFKKRLINLNVPEEQIICEPNSRDTVGDAIFSKQIIKKNHWSNILIVTSSYHANRALLIFERVYGTNYTIRVETTPAGDSKKKRENESSSLLLFKEMFKEVENGDDQQFLIIAREKHPFYNGNIFPKIIIK